MTKCTCGAARKDKVYQRGGYAYEVIPGDEYDCGTPVGEECVRDSLTQPAPYPAVESTATAGAKPQALEPTLHGIPERELAGEQVKSGEALLALECALLDVRNELEAARRKFPGNDHRLAALVEEIGELAQALLQGKAPGEVYTEAIQAAAMVVRLALEGDAQFGYAWSRACTEDFTRTEG